jgi:hypothetical protein
MSERVRDPCGRRYGCEGFSVGLSQAQLRSSIRASQLGMAEGAFSYEVDSAQLSRADLPNSKNCKNLRWNGKI